MAYQVNVLGTIVPALHPTPSRACRPLLRRSTHIRSQAAEDGSGNSSSSSRQYTPASTSGREFRNAQSNELPGGRPKGLKLERIERLGEEAWAGVAAIDRGEGNSTTSLGRIALLVGGDLSALLIFAAIGRANHGESLDPASVVSVAWPFIAGWFGAASLLGGFGKAAQGGRVGPAALAALKAWAVGVPVAIALRSLSRGYLPDKAFIIVSLVVTAVFLIGWRAGLAAATPEASPGTAAAQASRRQNKQGNPLEFLQLLFSLTKRW